ncbi:ATP-binding cassette domain-containing protein [Allonocardiopsis opalescens]|uniref:ABC-2 type transport system ATP-binding protein n=1 Tax=Allonocardiopsis opalescens TaxID=1144618 RepID=A0A2T0Q4P0_9ACTN|nr:ABC transporter ATP-binding protein [Allonocardiopsis opalescens]PRX98719.1 ABC-2 type transport system ATP-binding protein [Allonocardiopsis opalescens]
MSLDIELTDVHLRYGSTEALAGLSLRLEADTICGLLGRNGSGKTSLMSLLASLRRPDAGTVRIGGRDPFEDAELMSRVALIGEGGSDPTDNVADVLRSAALLRPSWDAGYAARLLDRFEVPRRKAIASLSRGKRAALGVTCGLAARAEITMFDETHLGMDAPSRYAFYDELLADYLEHPRTVILSTHHVEEVASLFAQVVIIDRGRLLVHDDTDEVRARGTQVTGPADAVDRFTAGVTVLGRRDLGRTRAAALYGTLTPERRRQAREAGLDIGPMPLQDLFVHLTADTEKEQS